MKLVWLPIVFSLAVIALANQGKIVDQYRAAYPADPAKRAAIEHCAVSPSFNRLDPDDREACYATAGVWPAAAALPARANPYYAFNPSQLPDHDIRREEVNQAYRGTAMDPAAPTVTPTNLIRANITLYRPTGHRAAALPEARQP